MSRTSRSGRFSGLFFLTVHLVNAFQHQENTEGNDQEVDDVLNELSVGEDGSSSLLGCGECLVVTVAERDKQVYEADSTGQLSDERHQHIVDE